MKRRTRLFVLGAAAILVVGLGTGLVASYVGIQNFAIIGSNGPAELQYVSKNTQWIAFANVREVMDSELRQKLRQFHPSGPADGPERFKEETGIDIESDVDRLVAAAAGPGTDPQHDRPLMLARGRFDQVRIEGLVQQHGGTVAEYRGKRVLNDDSDNISVAFIESDLVAVGTPSAVREALDTKASGSNITDDAEVMKLVHEVDNGNAWTVARFEALAKAPNIPAEILAKLPPITWFAASGHVNGGVHGTVRVVARDEASAQNLRDVVRGFMALARLQIGQRADLAGLLDSLQLSGDGTSVALDFAVPSEVIDALGALHAHKPADRGTPEPQPRVRRIPAGPASPSL